MKKISLTIIAFVTVCSVLEAQDKFYTKTGKIFFECTKSPLEKIEAANKSSTCVLDTKTGRLQFAVLMRGFEFERALMQEHFNENYVESSKFPKSDFKGEISNNNEINYTKDGEYIAKVKGNLQLHGQTQDVDAIGKIIIKQGRVIANARFAILLSDYNIRIPSLVSDKLSNSVNIIIDCNLELFKD
jgi:hypothetical protein